MSGKMVRFLAVCVCIACISPAHAVKAAKASTGDLVSSRKFTYQIAPVPDFVLPAPAKTSPDNSGSGVGDMLLVLYDRQISLLGKEPQEYVHLKSQPLTASGLQNASQVYVMFNPAYQRLALHAIRIWRNGREIDLTRRVKLDLMRREDNLDKNMYEGNVTAVGILPDTRVNDVIDLEYTVSGDNPIFKGRYSGVFAVTQASQLESYRLSLLAPESRSVHVRPPLGVRVDEDRQNGLARYTVKIENVEPFRNEDYIPKWFLQQRLVEVSEYRDWGQVGEWANGLFKVDESLSPEIREQIQRWKSAGLSREQLAVEVLRWVQAQVRYFGIELGVSSHLPSPPNVTVKRKFGDCKDKSLLLATLLKALGMDAEPVLASLGLNRNVRNMLPSPAAFDHAIVRLRLDGKLYWLDPTLSPQYGVLDKLGASDYGWVLVMGESPEKQLQYSDYPLGQENYYQKTSHFVLKSLNEPAELDVVIKANYAMAEDLRYAHDNQSRSEFNKIFQEDVLRAYPKAKPVGDVEFSDDRGENLITVTARFRLEDFLHYEPGRLSVSFYASELQKWASLPSVPQRVSPYALPVHSRLSETIEFEFPEALHVKPSKNNSSNSGEFWSFASSTDSREGKLVLAWTLKSGRDAVPAQKMAEYITETQNIRKQLAVTDRFSVGAFYDGDGKVIDEELNDFKRTYGETSSGRVAAEKRAAINVVLITRDIASNKLGSKQLAEAYLTRSRAYDLRGDVQHALEDIRAAEILVPDKVDYVVSEAMSLMADGQYAAAVQKFEQAIQSGKLSGSSLGSAYRGYGESLHYMGQDDKARKMLDEAILQMPVGERAYPAIWRFIASGKNSNDSAWVLQSAISGLQDEAWPYAVGKMLLGEITPEQLIDAAKSSDKGVQEDQYCEAYFYIGKKHQLDNEPERAREYFQKTLDQGVMSFIEYDFALHELGKRKMPKEKGFWKRFMSL